MDIRFSTLAAFSLVLFIGPLHCQTPTALPSSEMNWYATVQVQVRDSNGHPVSGLEPANFVINENGTTDPIVSVQSFQELTSAAPAPQSGAPNPQSSPQPNVAQSTSSAAQAARPTTWILIILAPMSATGRNASITGIQKFLNQPHPADWSFALFDDGGELTPFSKDLDAIRFRLNTLEHHLSKPQFIGGPWVPLAARAIGELAVRPGRRAIVFASDFVFDVAEPARNPGLLRVSPSHFIDAARSAQAPMYTLQASGPGVSTPFGDAASADVPEAMRPMTLGQIVANQINSNLVGLGAAVGDFAWSAYETGGRSARTMQEALEGIAEDAAGFYRITFRPHLLEADGSWHPISVQVRSPRVRARYRSFYVAPTSEKREQVPSAIQAALKSGASSNGFDLATRVWIFPDTNGMSTTVMAADIAWPPTEHPPAVRSSLQLYVQLINQNIGHPVGSWITEREWNSSGATTSTIHWQRELPLYPGSYELRISAFDSAAKRLATRTFAFAADPAGGFGTIRLSHTLLASRCLTDEEHQGRKNLLDPLLLNGCLLAPAASGIFSAQSKPNILVRLYAADRKLDPLILKHWKAFVKVGDRPPIPLTITRGAVRGFIASGQLDLEKLNLRPGKYQVTIGFDIGGIEPVFARPSELTITPEIADGR
jgi:VWFA-related protein